MAVSASAVAVSSNGTILYQVTYGADKGPTHTDWWMVGPDGNNAAKVEVPEGFTPAGFGRDGQSLYGAWMVNNHKQFAVFGVKDGKLAAAPS